MCSIFHLPDTFPILKSHVRGFFVTFNKNGVEFYFKKLKNSFRKMIGVKYINFTLKIIRLSLIQLKQSTFKRVARI